MGNRWRDRRLWLARKFRWGARERKGIAASQSLRSGLGAKHDVVSEPVEALNESLRHPVLVDAVEVIAAEIDESNTALEHMEDRDQDLVRDCHGGFLRAHSRLQAMELVAQVSALGLRCRDSRCYTPTPRKSVRALFTNRSNSDSLQCMSGAILSSEDRAHFLRLMRHHTPSPVHRRMA
jgi:hypothetical protein